MLVKCSIKDITRGITFYCYNHKNYVPHLFSTSAGLDVAKGYFKSFEDRLYMDSKKLSLIRSKVFKLL